MFTETLDVKLDSSAFKASLTQEAFLNSCIHSKTEVDIYIQTNHIYSCRILAHDTWAIMIQIGERTALLYKAAVQAIIPGQGRKVHPPLNSGQLLADVRTQYMRYLSKNRAAGAVKGN